MSKRSSLSDDVEGWLLSKGSDRLAEYANRGRKHQNLTIQELTAAWVHAYRGMVHNVRDPEHRAIEEDYKCEFLLRKTEPPYQFVREEFKRFMAEFERAMRYLETEAPSRFEEVGKELARDIETFKAIRDRTKS